MLSKNITSIFILSIIFLAILLRVFFINHLYWIDEAFTATIITQPSSTIISTVSKDVHPPLYFIILHYWNNFGELIFKNKSAKDFTVLNYSLSHQGGNGYFDIQLSSGEIIKNYDGINISDWKNYHIAPLVFLRLFNVLFGIASIFLLFLIGRILFKDMVSIQLIGCFLMAVSPFSIFWDTVIRSYNVLNFFVLLTVYVLLKMLKQFSPLRCMLFCILIVVTSLVNFIGIFFLPIYGLIILFNKWNRKRDKVYSLITLFAGFFLFMLLWGGKLSNQTTLVTSKNSLTVSAFFSNFIPGLMSLPLLFWKFMFSSAPWIELNSFSHPITYTIMFSFFAFLIVLSILNFARYYSREKFIVIGLILIPMLIPIFFNSIKPNSLHTQTRYFYSSLPFFCLFLSFGIQNLFELTLHRIYVKK